LRFTDAELLLSTEDTTMHLRNKTNVTPFSLIILVSYFIGLLDVCVTQPQEPATHQAITFSEKQCNAWGFEPSQLSCETCDLLLSQSDDDNELLTQFYNECKLCCQPWRINRDPETVGKSIYDRAIIRVNEATDDELHGVPPLIAAQLGIAPGGGGKTPMHEFIESEEFNDLVKEKGREHIKVEISPQQPPILLLFNEGNQGSEIDEADEVIDLRRWKREDVRDLLKYGLKSD